MGEKMYTPTCNIKWFRIDEGNKEKPVATIRAEYSFDDELWCLKQLWVSEDINEPDEWRDIECVA
jgi:hypothetical protein